MIYKWKEVSRIRVDAQTAGEICEKLEKNGGLTAKRLVDESRPENAPLHKEFEWDDVIAAEAYRENQARYIIRSLVIKTEKTESQPVRAFFTIAQNSEYQSVDVILSSQEKTSALFEMAMKELKAFQTKYQKLTQFKAVFEAIERVEKEDASE